jgi:hypothetical protein
MLTNFGALSLNTQLSFGLLISTTIFGFTSLLDGHKWAFFFEISRGILGLLFLVYPTEFFMLEINFPFTVFLGMYFSLSLLTTCWMYQSPPERSLKVA